MSQERADAAEEDLRCSWLFDDFAFHALNCFSTASGELTCLPFRIVFTKEKGRHVVATKDLEAGDLIMVEEIFISVISEKYLFTYCDYCHNYIDFWKIRLLRCYCRRCCCVYYCSTECKKKARKQHKKECDYLSLALLKWEERNAARSKGKDPSHESNQSDRNAFRALERERAKEKERQREQDEERKKSYIGKEDDEAEKERKRKEMDEKRLTRLSVRLTLKKKEWTMSKFSTQSTCSASSTPSNSSSSSPSSSSSSSSFAQPHICSYPNYLHFQELISNKAHFLRGADQRLSPSWRFVYDILKDTFAEIEQRGGAYWKRKKKGKEKKEDERFEEGHVKTMGDLTPRNYVHSDDEESSSESDEELNHEASSPFSYFSSSSPSLFFVSWEEFLENLFRVECNNFADQELYDLCDNLLIVCAMLNHSCTPNVYWRQSSDRHYSFRALTDVRAGDELCISYFSLEYFNYDERKKKMANYFFECNCSLCQVESPKKKFE